ncbi:MAG: NAD(P)-dependent oxidoreductase [Deltaproteobacteria bacterium]|nr:NAD(P)-dependent oxidoreductase [Deltaproteobacteria bacterium]
MSLKGKTIVITGSSRGIGREMALRFAKDGANLVIAAKSVTEGKLPGTIYSVAKEVEAAGGQALPIPIDLRHDDSVLAMIEKTIEQFGKIDVLVNNAGAIALSPLQDTPMKRADLMLHLNMRAVLLCSHYCIPHLKKAGGGHILNLSPPISTNPKWYARHVVYTISKYGMTMATLGLAEELKKDKIAVNSLWPRTAIATAAISMLLGEAGLKLCRTPAIMADAAYEILNTDPSQLTGQSLIDEDFLKACGITDFSAYQVDPDAELALDLFVEGEGLRLDGGL